MSRDQSEQNLTLDCDSGKITISSASPLLQMRQRTTADHLVVWLTEALGVIFTWMSLFVS